MICEDDAQCTFNCPGGGCTFRCPNGNNGQCDVSCGNHDNCERD
jgi:hypothetical protein